MEIGGSGPVLSQNITPKATCDNDIHTLQHGRIYCCNSSYLLRYSRFLTILSSPRH